MNIPCTLDLRLGQNKAIVDDLIARDGKTKDVNELALTVYCDTGAMRYEIVQFHRHRYLIDILPGLPERAV